MKKIFLFVKNGGNETLVGRYDSKADAQEKVMDMVEEDSVSVFNFRIEEREYEDITNRVKSYADACKVLGIEPMDEDSMKAQNPDNGEETRDDTKYYKVEAEVAISTENEEEPEKKPYDFIVRTKDVDTAKVVITAWINAKVKERTERDGDERKVVDLSILSASPFACNAIVDKAFCLAYREQEV